MTRKWVNCTHPCIFASFCRTPARLNTVFSLRCTQAMLSKKHHFVTPTNQSWRWTEDFWMYHTWQRKVWLERDKKEISLSHSISSLKKKKKKTKQNRNSENQHNPGIIQKWGGEEGQSEERDCNTFVLWMRFYSCLLQYAGSEAETERIIYPVKVKYNVSGFSFIT